MNRSSNISQLATMILILTCLMSCKGTIEFDYNKRLVLEPDSSLVKEFDKSIYDYYGFNTSIGNWYEKSECCDWSGIIDNKIKRAGNGSLKVELRKDDVLFGHRSELGTQPSKRNKDGWYAVSLYFPSSYIKDDVEESIVQWQALPDFDLGENWRSAPLFFGVLKDRFILDNRTDTNRVTVQGKSVFTRADLGEVEKDTWVDWVFHIKWAYDNTGIIEVWKNKIKLYSKVNLPNSYNDVHYPYFKVGIYRYGWDDHPNNPIKSRTIYIDEVKIGNENCDLQKISLVKNN